MADLLNIGLSGLSSNKTSLAVTGHNITNVNTPGFTRQSTVQGARTPQYTGAGFIGSGTTLTDVRRSYSEFLTNQVRSSTSLSSDVEAYKAQIEQLDSLLAGSTTGISPAIQNFFSALQTAAEDPSNIPARQLVLSQAEGLARRFNTVSDRITEQNSFINTQMSAVTDQINRLSGSIASLNDAIAKSAANGQQPNDLLDAREEAVRQLATYVGVTTVPQDDNTVNIFIGTGQPLVVGSSANRLEATAGKEDPSRFEIEFVSGTSRQGVTSLISGGELGGLVRYRSETLDPTLNSLGRLALSISDQINSQLGQGVDLKGQAGSSLFGDYNTADLAALRVKSASGNTGTASPALYIGDTESLTTSDYRLEFDGTNYTARRISDGAKIDVQVTALPAPSTEVSLTFTDSAGRDQGFNVQIDPSGVQKGDVFQLQPTRRAAGTIEVTLDQPDQLAFAAPIRSINGSLDANGNIIGDNRGTGVMSQPTLVSNGSALDIAALQGFSKELSYDATTGFTVAAPDTLTLKGGGSFVPGQVNTYTLTSGGQTIEFTISGKPEQGDTFTLAFNATGVSDNRNALQLVDLQNKQVIGVDPTVTGIATGSSFTDSYGDTVERVGTLTAQARQDSEATTAILKQATDNRDSLSAVNLDEEAANLIKFEQYYNASAQVIQVARSLFDTLIGTFR
ncbi:Flagellar hook-associated protein flgK [Pseudomonas marincola]|uniref:Flagellar hook-associated protein 1 n=1 Tax=Pseudomonas marincola TaxID=437900 RepID=A0A653DXC3_9PSED|nr:flagellar hook-associated protein FlgK [Pseudomonas marincola]CAE6929848.1 Flagellar hook-associated protein flgK [Pseudomonas marincola]